MTHTLQPECRACRLKSASIAAFAQSAYELREETWTLQRRITDLEAEREELLIDREVFRAWCREWMPEIVVVMIGLQRDIHNLNARLRHVVHERDEVRNALHTAAAKFRAATERVA